MTAVSLLLGDLLGGATNHSDSYLQRLFSPENLPSIGLFLAGIVGIIVAICTLITLNRQANEMKLATKAMEQSTGVMMGAERARILTDWNEEIHYDASPGAVHDGHLSHCFNWACENVGKTHAQLKRTWSRFIVLQALADLPEIPDFSGPNEQIYEGEPLQPNASKRQTVWFCAHLETDLPYKEMQEKYRRGDCILYAYGYAQYTDAWGIPHETRFGLVRSFRDRNSTDTWVMAGPAEYNKYT